MLIGKQNSSAWHFVHSGRSNCVPDARNDHVENESAENGKTDWLSKELKEEKGKYYQEQWVIVSSVFYLTILNVAYMYVLAMRWAVGLHPTPAHSVHVQWFCKLFYVDSANVVGRKRLIIATEKYACTWANTRNYTFLFARVVTGLAKTPPYIRMQV